MAKTFKSLREAAEAGYHGKSVNIEGKGLQKVVFADKAYDKRMSEIGSKKTQAPPARPAPKAPTPPKPRPANLKTPRADRDQQSGPKASTAPARAMQEDRATRIAKPAAPNRRTKDDKVTPTKKPTKAQTPFQRLGSIIRGGGLSSMGKKKDK
jgi:hypothetical protein